MRLGILGRDIQYTRSPQIYTLFSELTGVTIDYEIVDLTLNELPTFFKELHQKRYSGLSVTRPYKGSVVAFVPSQDELVRTLHNANLVHFSVAGPSLKNTDLHGFTFGYDWNLIQSDDTLVILGAGASARMAAYFLHERFPQHRVLVGARDIRKLQRFLHWARENLNVQWERLDDFAVVDSPTKNMWCIHAASTGFDLEKWPSLSLATVRGTFDLNYQFEDTVKDQCDYWDGQQMLLQQAALAFELCTDIKILPAQIQEIRTCLP